MNNLKRPNRPLLDKTIYYNFDVTKIYNYDELLQSGIITNSSKPAFHIPDAYNNDLIVSSIVIKPNSKIYVTQNGITRKKMITDAYGPLPFLEFTYEYTRDGSLHSVLALPVEYDDYHNLNCMTVDEKLSQINKVQIFLNEKIGIEVNFSDLKYSYIEINNTFCLEHPFSEYVGRPLIFARSLIPQSFYFNTDSKHRKTYSTSFSSGKTGVDVRIYDKSLQLSQIHKIITDRSYTRFEITLKSSKKIKTIFNTTRVTEISQEMINLYYQDFITNAFIKPRAMYFEVTLPQLVRKIFKENYVPKSKTFLKGILDTFNAREIQTYTPELLDVRFLIDNLSTIRPKIDRKKQYVYRIRFEELCKDQKYIHFNGSDYLKYNEYLNNLSGGEKNEK